MRAEPTVKGSSHSVPFCPLCDLGAFVLSLRLQSLVGAALGRQRARREPTKSAARSSVPSTPGKAGEAGREKERRASHGRFRRRSVARPADAASGSDLQHAGAAVERIANSAVHVLPDRLGDHRLAQMAEAAGNHRERVAAGNGDGDGQLIVVDVIDEAGMAVEIDDVA